MAATTSSKLHHEIEDKFDADPGFELPDLSHLPGVHGIATVSIQELEAVYLDSTDLRLARHHTTLRHRTGGDDAGWHLKLPGAKQGRIEIRRPPIDRRSNGSDANTGLTDAGGAVTDVGGTDVGIGDVPNELLDLIRVHLRGEPVTRVARITTRRAVHRLLGQDGAVLAEVADDEVMAVDEHATDERGLRPLAWREIEVELVEGDSDFLAGAGTLLAEAGARPPSATSKLRRVLSEPLSILEPATQAGLPRHPSAGDVVVGYLRDQVTTLIAEDPRVRLETDDAVHQMRVATRRLRAVLAGFGEMFVPGAAAPLRDELKWLGERLGAARDAEVMMADLATALAAQPTELVLGPVQRRVDLEFRPMYREAYTQVIDALNSDRYLRLVAALEAFVTAPPLSARARKPARAQLRRCVKHACRRVKKAHSALNGDQAHLDQQLHEVRIAAKKARYAAEVSRPVVGKKAKALAVEMEAIQEILGDHQDAVVRRHGLRDLGIRAFLAGENGFTFGRLHGLADARAQHDEEQFARVWARTRSVVARWPG
jgi:CHAD domain-containing protein